MSSPAVARPEIEAALLLLAKLGLTPDDLAAGMGASRTPVPTFAEFVPQVEAAVNEGARTTYGTYWKHLVERWGTRHINEPSHLELAQLAKQVRAHRLVRRNDRGGGGAEAAFVGAARCLYRYAVDCGILTEAENPAAKVRKPRRPPSARRAIPDDRLAELHHVAATTGDDPALDSLLLRFHSETACRRGGALNVRRCDLDEEQCLVRLREKGFTSRWQPVSPTLMRHLLAQWDERGDGNSTSTAQLLRSRSRKPITARRYDGLWNRLGRVLPWVAVQGISTHWLRHTILKWVERTFGYAVARAFAGHSESGNGGVGSTAIYVRADIAEVAAALSALIGEPHPLAPGEDEPLNRL